MVSSSSSRPSSISSSSSYQSFKESPASVSPSPHPSASSSQESLNDDDEENVTITGNRVMAKRAGKQKSSEDLRLLAVSTHMTELSYTISDIQTRIFEIQELRHKSQSSGDTVGTTNVIDQSLMNLDERLEAVGKGMKTISESLEHFSQGTPTPSSGFENGSHNNHPIFRKHANLVAEWEAVQDESEVLREELKEDKWLTVFRTVTDQADGMMSSLEKAVNRCQDFIWQVHRRGPDDTSSLSSLTSDQADKPNLTFEVFTSLLESFEAKKKHYMPATSKVLSIIDKGVQDRVTKNGETLRRHAESAQRWRNLRERIARTDAEMDGVRKILLGAYPAPSEASSNASYTSSTSHTKNGYLATPQKDSQQSRPSSVSSTMSRSISPFRKFARKIRGNPRPSAPVTPVPPSKHSSQPPSSDPVNTLRAHKSIFSFRGGQPPMPVTPDRPGHKYSQSLTPESSPASKQVDGNATMKNRAGSKQRWNSSTKVEQDDRSTTIKAAPLKRHPAPADAFSDAGDHVRSVSRSSMGSSRPWTPVTSTTSTVASSNHSGSATRPPPQIRPPSRAQTPSLALGTSPRARPKTPSQIPAPAKTRYFSGQSDAGWDDDEMPTSLMQRAFSPAFSSSAGSADSPSSNSFIPPRPPSRSMIPVPSLQFSSASRPSSAMSRYRSESPPSSFKGLAARAQTPEYALRARVQQVPFYQAPGSNPRGTHRPSLANKVPPSSYKDSGRSPTSTSRPSSRSGAYTPGFDQNPVHEYIPTNPRDPLDAEVAAIVNSIAHGLLVERVDPPLKTIPKEGEEIRAQYAFSTSLSRKVVTCRLTTLTRSGRTNANGDKATKKVMCRVGGGWQDLQLYMLNRQAGL